LSSLFQNLKKKLGYKYLDVDISELVYYFFKEYKFENYHPLDKIPFNSKYICFSASKFKFIKLRFKDIDKWSEYLSELFSDKIELTEDNLTVEKEYNSLYDSFKKEIFISQEMFDFFTTQETFLKYNSTEEQNAYKEMWLSRVKPDSYFTGLLSDLKYLNIPDNFDSGYYYKKYLKNNSFSLLDCKVHYDFLGWREEKDICEQVVKYYFCYTKQCKFEYGSNERMIDVTSIILKMIRKNVLKIVATKYNDIFGDPLEAVVKYLKVTEGTHVELIKEDTDIHIFFHFRNS